MPRNKVVTKKYDENRESGIMICGINHGYSIKDRAYEQQESTRYISDSKSFFSDSRLRPFPFRSRLKKWFQLWGHALEEGHKSVGSFEQSLFHTNWLNERNKDVARFYVGKRCITENEPFFDVLKDRNPLIIFLISVQLHDALRHNTLKREVSEVLGAQRAHLYNRSAGAMRRNNRTKKPRFRAKVTVYEKAVVVAIPHTQARGLTSHFVDNLGEDLGLTTILSAYKVFLQQGTNESRDIFLGSATKIVEGQTH